MKVFVILALLAAPRIAAGCDCIATGTPPCSAYGQDSVIFTGTVVSATVETVSDQPSGHKRSMRRVHFAIQESFRGAQSNETDIFTGLSEPDCGYGFRVGESYLVYASEWLGRLTTGICHRTNLLANAKEDLDYLHSLTTAQSGVSVLGTIRRLPSHAKMGTNPEPLANVKVNIVSKDGEAITLISGSDGKFLAAGLNPGTYTVKPELPPSLVVPYSAERTAVLPDHACAQEDFFAVVNGRITGRAVNEDGSPAAKVPLILDTVDSSNKLLSYLNGTTDADGHFEFKGLEPGEYVLGVTLINPPMEANPYPKTFYPGVTNFNEATLLRLSEAEQVSNLEFRLPAKLAAIRVPIEVVWADGKLANGSVLSVTVQWTTLGIADSLARPVPGSGI